MTSAASLPIVPYRCEADGSRAAGEMPSPVRGAAVIMERIAMQAYNRARWGLLLGLLAATSACSTRQGFEQRMAAHIGQSEGDLVAALGVPTRTYQADGRRFIQYDRQRILADAYPGWGWRWGGPTVEVLDCHVTFEIERDRVQSFTSRGNDCVARPPS
jgi:hypothetical protein